jgi:CHC2-type zinc finger protein
MNAVRGLPFSHSEHLVASNGTISSRQISALVPMAQLLAVLGFTINERTRRSACILHGGSNRSAFSWTEAGLWKCHSCGAGGDRIALVRAVKKCNFRDALEFLGQLAGLHYSARRVSRCEIERAKISRERAENAAWRVRDELIRLRSFYLDGLHRAERLVARMGEEILRSRTEAERDAAWECIARLAPAQTFFLAGYNFLCGTSGATLVGFALASPEQRRAQIFGDTDGNTRLQAA